jgi:2'-5' RNA ligase
VRLFVAVWPPAEVVDALDKLSRPEQSGVRWTTREQWHVTLRFLGQMVDVDEARRAFARIDVDSVGSVFAEMGPATACLGRGVLHVPVRGLDELARATVEATAGVGRPPEDRSFRGHLTLARARGGRGDLRRLRGSPLAASWKVAEVTLVASTLRRDGSRYEVVTSLPLA